MDEYIDLNTVPALVGIAFAVSSAVQFELASVTVDVLDYTPAGVDLVLLSMAALAIAFASSETKDFRYYSDQEKLAIAIGPVLIIGQHYVTEIADIIANNDPAGGVIAFALAMLSWGVVSR